MLCQQVLRNAVMQLVFDVRLIKQADNRGCFAFVLMKDQGLLLLRITQAGDDVADTCMFQFRFIQAYEA